MFDERPLVSKTGKKRSPVAGVGINDAWYVTGYIDDSGKKVTCPYYSVWAGMLERVYSASLHSRQPTYKGSTVDPDWLVFSKFRTWMEQQDWVGKALDKDLLISGNKHYSPDTCLFVSQQINSLTVIRSNARGSYPLGVVKTISGGYTYYIARCSFYGKQRVIGSFKTPEEASAAYLTAKREHIQEIAMNEVNLKVRKALLNYSLTF